MAKKQHFCDFLECRKPVPKAGFCSPECKRIAKAPWVIRGGVGGTMFCGSAGGIWPYCWKIRRDHSRQWAYKEDADRVAALVNGRVERML